MKRASDVRILPHWLPAWLVALVLTVAIQMSGFVVALALRTEKFFDFLGAANFLVLALGTWLVSGEIDDPRRLVATSLFVASRIWLLCFLCVRAGERGDTRFEEVKDDCLAFLPFWLGQALWVFLISLPVLAVNLADGPTPPMDAAGYVAALLFAACLVTQIHSDLVKRWWVQGGREGHFCQRGCWHFSRHPNYFGEMGMTLGAVGLAGRIMFAADGTPNALALLSVLSPIFTFLILMFASGMPLAEGKALRRYYDNARDDYQAYRAQTPILFPWLCSGFALVPLRIKRLCCCEWMQYELPNDIRAELGMDPYVP